MNTAINVIISLVSLIALLLSVVLALRARRQFGFVAPLGFLVAVLVRRMGVIIVWLMDARFAAPESQEAFRQRSASFASEDLMFLLSTGGHATGIWFLGAICFLLCGLLDLRADKDAPAGKRRWALMFGGAVLFLLSAFYPCLVMKRWF